MYTEAELQVLATLNSDSTISKLADDLNRSVNYTSELVSEWKPKA